MRDWNAHHKTWSVDDKENSVVMVLAYWVDEVGARVIGGGDETFMRRRLRGVIQSRIDFMLVENSTLVSDEFSA